MATKKPVKFTPDVLSLQKFLKGSPKTIEQICNHLDMSPRRAEDLFLKAKKQGLIHDVAHGHVGFQSAKPDEATKHYRPVIVQKSEGQWRRFAVTSDEHLGSKFHLGDFYLDFLRKAHDEYGCRTFFSGGDRLDGTYRHSLFEQTAHGFDEQASLCLKAYPDYKDSQSFFITGNHENTMAETSGLEVGEALVNLFKANNRPNMTYLGPRAGSIRLLQGPDDKKGVKVNLWHPRGSGAYAVSYKLQKKIESYGPGQKPDLLFVGHYHQQAYIVSRGIHSYMAGTFHGHGGDFGNSLIGGQSIGGWIIEYRLTPQGTLRDVRSIWVAYYEQERDRVVRANV